MPEYISSLTMWMPLDVAKCKTKLSSFRLNVVPNGFDGFVIKIPFTRTFCFSARSNASSIAFDVILKPFELQHSIGIICTPVRHFRSLSNLHFYPSFYYHLLF